MNAKDLFGERATYEFIDWLDSIGYFDCPASISHHGNVNGGLFSHCLLVANQLNNLTKKLNLKWDMPDSPYIVGLLHDICKCDDYVLNNDLKWEYNKNKKMDGHGDKSILMLSGHFDLTPQESKCIQFHMGSFTDKEQWKYYCNAIKEEPNVLYTHMADMIASQILEDKADLL